MEVLEQANLKNNVIQNKRTDTSNQEGQQNSHNLKAEISKYPFLAIWVTN